MDTRSIRRSARTSALILFIAAVAQAGLKHDFDRTVFVYAYHPDLPMSRFVAGTIGIPEPQHARIYLFAAYRYFEGRPFSAREQQMWLRVWQSRASHEWPGPPLIPASWTTMRKQVPLAGGPARPVRTSISLRDSMYSELCNADAYEGSARTLADRIRRFGRSSREVKFWTEGQDAVLRTCETSVPEKLAPAPAGMKPLIRADREYQHGAMLFYAQQFDEALRAFRQIAADATSPWRTWAPYMVGRTLLWQARQTQSEALYKQKLAEAEAQFHAVLADPTLRSTHGAADYLLLRCMLIRDPRRALERIAARLNRGNWRESDLTLYLNALDALERAPRPSDPLSEWILAFSSDRTYARGLARWRQTKSRAWLYAALWRAPKGAAEDLVSAAVSTATLPALRFAAARLLATTGRFDEARLHVDAALSALGDFPSAQNRAAQLRTQLSSDVDEFIRRSPRTATYSTTEMDTAEWPDGRPRAAHMRTPAMARFDEISAAIFNERLPLATMARISSSEALPQHLRDEIQLVAWTKAVLLNRFAVARELAGTVSKRLPKLQPRVDAFVRESSQDCAAFILLELPGARPYVSRGYGRNLGITEHDEWARNWWYRFSDEEMHGIDLPYVGDRSRLPPPMALLPELPFVTAVDRSHAAEENAVLRKTGERGLNWIATRIAQAIERDPKHPDAAESLFRVLKSARISNWAHRPDFNVPQPGLQAAYRLLSTRYRRTQWFRRFEPNSPGVDIPPLQ
jgi:tetratricopeptide (TPR) repeat protein